MTRVLWVTAEAPDHTASGGRIRQAYLLDALAAVADVHLLLVGTLEDDAIGAVCADVEELTPPATAPPRGRAARYVSAVTRRDPPELHRSRAVRQVLARAIDGRGFDVVHVEHAELAPLALEVPRGPEPWTLDLHYLPSTRLRHAVPVAPSRRARVAYRLDARKAARSEDRMVRRFDRVVVCSPEDATALPIDSHVVPNGVDLQRFATDGPLPNAPRLVFTGHLSYPPNVHAVRWFATEVMPRIRGVVSDASLEIVGRTPLPVVTELGDLPGVTVVPDVPDVLPHLEAARVAVVPVHVGSGTRLKVLEAMAAGRPVVGTTVGLEGLGIEDGRHALVADTAGDTAVAVLTVLTDDGRAAEVASAGRDLAARFAWATIGDRFVAAVLGRD